MSEWKHIETIDLCSAIGECALCGTRIRYIHRVTNTETMEVMDIGCECAEKILSGEELNYIQEQDKAIKSAARKAKAEADKLQKNFEEFNKRQIDNNRAPFSFEEYIAFIESIRIKNEEYAAKKAAKKKRRKF